MPNKFHKDLTLDDIHAANARTYADIAARDADTAFHSVATNVNKIVRIDSPVSYFILAAVTPTWVEFSNLGLNEFIELIDTPANYSGAGSQLVQVNSGATALEFTPSPTAATDFLVGAARPITTDAGLELRSTTKAFIPSRMTTAERDLLTASAGMMVFNTNLSAPDFYSGTGWVSMALGGGDVVGPGSATDNAIARFDLATGKIIQNSLVTIGDTGIISTVTDPVAAQDAATKAYVDANDFWDKTGSAVHPISNSDSIAIGATVADNIMDLHRSGEPTFLALTSVGTGFDVGIKFEFADDLATFVLGVDNSDADKFKISTTGLAINTRFTIDSAGLIGIGTDSPNNLLDIHNAAGNAALAITAIGADFDPVIKFELVDNAATFVMGVDDSEGDHFAISAGADISLFKRFVIDSTGRVGIGTADPDQTLHVQGVTDSTAEIRISTAVDAAGEISRLAFSIPVGDPQSGIKGTTQSAGVMDLALFVQSASTPSFRFDALTILGATGFVGIGDTTPTNVLDVHHATAESAIAITSLGAGFDALIKFEMVDDTAIFSMGVDDSDADKFKIGTTALAASTRFTIDSAGNVGIGTTSPASLLEVDGQIRLTSDNSNNLFLGKMNAASNEGGRMLLEGGAVSDDTWIVDSFFQNLRIFTTSANTNFVVISNTAGGQAGLKVEGGTVLGGTGTGLATLDLQGTLNVKRTGYGGTDPTTVNEVIIGMTDTSSPRTVTLQTADAVAGRLYIIKDESGGAGTNNITINTQGGGETIDGDSTLVIASDFGGVILYSDNVNWFVAAKT